MVHVHYKDSLGEPHKTAKRGFATKGEEQAGRERDFLARTSGRLVMTFASVWKTYKVGMSCTYLAEIEIGKHNVLVENIDRIAGGLGMSLREFFDSEFFG